MLLHCYEVAEFTSGLGESERLAEWSQAAGCDILYLPAEKRKKPEDLSIFGRFTSFSNYQTRQAFSRTIGCPALQPKAFWNSGELLTTPFVRNSPGECESVAASSRKDWSVAFWHQTCA